MMKPVIIDAVQYNGSNFREILDFCQDSAYYKDEHPVYDGILMIKTLEGDMKVSINDYVIKGIKGEFYPCKPDIFEKTYEKVD